MGIPVATILKYFPPVGKYVLMEPSSKVSPRLPGALIHPLGMMLQSSGNPVKTWNQSGNILGILQFLGWSLHLLASDSDWPEISIL